jgi:hypothetical protein
MGVRFSRLFLILRQFTKVIVDTKSLSQFNGFGRFPSELVYFLLQSRRGGVSGKATPNGHAMLLEG